MARITKRQVIDEFNEVFEECKKIYENQLKLLMEQKKITTGHYYYVLNPYNEYCASKFYGFNKDKAMISHENDFKLWDFQYMLKELKNHKQEMLEVVEEYANA